MKSFDKNKEKNRAKIKWNLYLKDVLTWTKEVIFNFIQTENKIENDLCLSRNVS